VNRPPIWIRLLGVSAWTLGLLIVMLGPGDYSWRPSVSDRWLWAASDTSTVESTIVDSNAAVVVLDPFSASAQTVGDLHHRQRAAVCLLRAGVWEPVRPDAARFDVATIGAPAPSGGRWVDVRRWDLLSPILTDRLALCAAKGFDGAALLDLDGFAYPSGFPLTRAEQFAFNSAVVDLAHKYRLVVGLVATGHTPSPPSADVIVADPDRA
jgi:hypothetical protein